MLRRRIFIASLLGLAAALWMIHLKLYWFSHTPSDRIFYGYLQGDQKTYAALVRAAMKSPNGFSYVYPWDISNEPRAIFFQLPIAINAWIARAWGISAPPALHNVFDLFRLIFSPLMFLALARLIHLYFPRRRMFWIVFVAAGFGGGVAWIAALAKLHEAPSSGLMDYLGVLFNVEIHYRWWFLNIFRNIYFPLEVFYHFLFFSMAVCLLTRRYAAALVFYAMGLSSTPFIAIQMTSVLLPALFLDLWRWRADQARTFFAAACVLFGLFISYYKIFLYQFPAARSLQTQHQGTATDPLYLSDMVLGYGPFLFIPIVSIFHRSFIRRQWRSRHRRVLIIWIAASLFLTQNSRILPWGLQPRHFEKGYLYLPLVLWSFQYLEFVLRPRFANWRDLSMRSLAVASIAVSLLLPDTFLFALTQYEFTPTDNDLVYSKDHDEVLRHFKNYRGRVLLQDALLSKIMAAETNCPTYWGDMFTTPMWDEREADFRNFIATGAYDSFRKKYGVTAFVLFRSEIEQAQKSEPALFQLLFPEDKFAISIRNEKFVVFELKQPAG
ncbi:hypothetical protein HYR69_12140 [Candidatus Sumerlaeota bacterium]|nr:hypothetical protein [Candidatus Sumerlaeota bacterium]